MKKIVVAGGTGDLGKRIVNALVRLGAEVHVIVRHQKQKEKINALKSSGISVTETDFKNIDTIATACAGAHCVVSALAGLRDVIVDAQKVLLDGAIEAKVPRFIPSDYSIDFTKFNEGKNRNLDLRREFHRYLDNAPIASTSIFIGAFMELLIAEMPLILFKQKKILYWGEKNHPLQFTTKDDTANYTAHVALDDTSRRKLHIAGDLVSPLQFKTMLSQITGTPYSFLHPGGLSFLSFMIKVVKTVAPSKGELYPAWQGMQYMRNMIDKSAVLERLDNGRYPDIKWTGVREMLSAREIKAGG